MYVAHNVCLSYTSQSHGTAVSQTDKHTTHTHIYIYIYAPPEIHDVNYSACHGCDGYESNAHLLEAVKRSSI